MALSAEDIAEIDAMLGEAKTAASAFAELRARFPKLSLTRADASNLGMETPFREFPRFDLHLVNGAGHCWSLTDNTELATGLVIAACADKP